MQVNQFPDETTFLKLSENHNVIPVVLEILADTETPVSLMKKVYNRKGPVFLLESVDGGERWGRYSFLGISARSQLRVFPTTVEIRESGKTRQLPHHNDPLGILRQYMQEFRPASVSGLPRFWGGMVGYITYEMVSFFESIPNNLPDDKSLAHFMIPDELLIFDNVTHTLSIVAVAFVDEDKTAAAEYQAALARIRVLQDSLAHPINAAEPHCRAANNTMNTIIGEEVFRQQVREVKKHIQGGDIIQAVISQPFICEHPPDLISLYRAQRFINPSPYLFFVHLDGTALIGSSPETMVRLENGQACLRPIAGTRPRGRTEQEDRRLADDLLKDEKERAEHLMLVDLGRNDLGRVAETGTVQVTDLMLVERYSHVMHLVSNITCDLRPEVDAWDLLAATFPAGTLSGAPKVRAMEIISEIEKAPRGPYGGAVGYISFCGNMDMAITIRTACVEDDRLIIRAGAGIVADSDPEKERLETVNKAKAIQKALQLLQNNHIGGNAK
ncbi:anthranilate synthase component I family protein [Thermodesulfobacteriota bacterium]